MLADLPQDLLLAILKYLGVEEIVKLRCISKAWDTFINENQPALFRAAAVLEFNIPSWANLPQDLQELYSPRALAGISTWKDFCARLIQIKKSWRGAAQSTITSHQYAGDLGVHRFKIDERVGLIIATASHGGLYVTDLNASKWYHGRVHNPASCPVVNRDSAVIWSLPEGHVVPFAHCEYDHGYLIFDRRGGSKEVWRLADYDRYYGSQSSGDDASSSLPNVIDDARPDNPQIHASEAWQPPNGPVYNGGGQRSPTHGQFIPWALLHTPRPTRAFRFIYPTLLAVSFSMAYLYDVHTGKMVQEIGDLQTAQPNYTGSLMRSILGNVSYVDHSPEYIFACGVWSLRVFSRLTGQCVYEISTISCDYQNLRWKIEDHRNEYSGSLQCISGYVDDDPLKAWGKSGSALYKHVVVEDKERHPLFSSQIIAAHVSSCGNFLVLLIETSRILIIRDLERIFKGEISHLDCSIQIQLGRASRFSRYLAFENGRIGVATRNGVFIVIPDPAFFSSAPLTQSFAPPSVLRVHALNNFSALGNVSCLQMTQSGLFATWFAQCPLTSHSPTYPEDLRKQVHSAQEDVFWKGLTEPLGPMREWHNDTRLAEDGIMTVAELGGRVVLSVDFVPT